MNDISVHQGDRGNTLRNPRLDLFPSPKNGKASRQIGTLTFLIETVVIFYQRHKRKWQISVELSQEVPRSLCLFLLSLFLVTRSTRALASLSYSVTYIELPA